MNGNYGRPVPDVSVGHCLRSIFRSWTQRSPLYYAITVGTRIRTSTTRDRIVCVHDAAVLVTFVSHVPTKRFVWLGTRPVVIRTTVFENKKIGTPFGKAIVLQKKRTSGLLKHVHVRTLTFGDRISSNYAESEHRDVSRGQSNERRGLRVS